MCTPCPVDYWWYCSTSQVSGDLIRFQDMSASSSPSTRVWKFPQINSESELCYMPKWARFVMSQMDGSYHGPVSTDMQILCQILPPVNMEAFLICIIVFAHLGKNNVMQLPAESCIEFLKKPNNGMNHEINKYRFYIYYISFFHIYYVSKFPIWD